MYKLTICCWYNSRLSHEHVKSLRVYATRDVRARAKPRPILDLIDHAHHSAGLQACGDERRDYGRSIVASALWLVAALALYFNEFLCHV